MCRYYREWPHFIEGEAKSPYILKQFIEENGVRYRVVDIKIEEPVFPKWTDDGYCTYMTVSDTVKTGRFSLNRVETVDCFKIGNDWVYQRKFPVKAPREPSYTQEDCNKVKPVFLIGVWHLESGSRILTEEDK
jgi:hypothetical protein